MDKTVIDRISQPNGSVIIVYSDGTTKLQVKNTDVKITLIYAKKWGIKKKTKVA